MKTKSFDCVRTERQGTEQVMKRREGKTVAEQLEYWEKGTEELRKRQRDLRDQKSRSR